MLSYEEALRQILLAAAPLTESETVSTQAGAGRVLAQEVVALVDVPPADNAQMDGYALRCADVPAVPCELPVRMRVAAGQQPGVLPPGSAARIFTGAAIPVQCDAVVMQEATRSAQDTVLVLQAPSPGQWIRRTGSDLRRGASVLARGQVLHPQHLGIAAAAGVAHLAVVRRPRVTLFCTGDELAMPGEDIAAQAPRGRIYNSNRFVLTGLLQALGCTVRDLGIVPDSLAATLQALTAAAGEADLILSSGGVSVGEEDHVKAALSALGQLQQWQIAIKPGKPLVLGKVGAAPFIGLPGNPVSSFVTFVLLVRPFLLRRMGVDEVRPRALPLRADFEYSADPARREFLRARSSADGGVSLFPSQNSALLSSVAWADGLVDLAPGARVTRGQPVSFLPLANLTGPA